MKILALGALLISLTACGSVGPDAAKPAQSKSSGKVVLPAAPPPPALEDDRIVCTADVKQCPDGSFVSRNPGKGCAFALCPGETQP